MAGDNRWVTENFMRLNFTPKSGINPGTNDTLWMDCDQILARYNVSVSGVTTTGKRLPSQNQVLGLIAPTIVVSNITSTDYQVNYSCNSSPEYLTKIGFVIFKHQNGLITDTPSGSDEKVVLIAEPLNTYTYRTGSYGGIGTQNPNTTYYTRAVYQTSTGTYYGPEISFTTLP